MSQINFRAQIDEYTNRVLGVIKEKYGLKDKAQALNKFANMFGEDFVEREVKEEFKVDVYDVKPFGWYSDPKRDPRGHMIAHVMIGKTDQKPRPGDDIEKVKFFLFDLIPEIMAFDHRKILDDYIARYETN